VAPNSEKTMPAEMTKRLNRFSFLIFSPSGQGGKALNPRHSYSIGKSLQSHPSHTRISPKTAQKRQLLSCERDFPGSRLVLSGSGDAPDDLGIRI